jgi:Plasmid pRiA4b ORF-3-like protein
MSPLIWRRVLVRSDMTLAHLHTLLQIVFAWSNEHLHSFHIHGREYGSSGALTCSVQLRDFCLHCGERFRYVYDFGAHWACDIRLEARRPLEPRRVYPVCIGGKGAGPPEDCGGAWAYMERLEQHRLSPPLEAMGVVADAISTQLETDPQTSVREALGDLDDLREAVDCLEAYQAFQPDSCDCRHINTQLQSRTWPGGATR